MKRNLTFCTYILITAFSSDCMENIQRAKVLQEITIIQEPVKAEYIKKDRAIILGKNGCSIINPITNQEIIKMSDDSYEYYSFLDLSPDKKEIALSRHNTIKICNADTGEQVWTKKNSYDMNKVTFSPQGKSLFLVCNDMNQNWSTIKKYDYTTGESSSAYIDYAIYPNIALHPTQNILCTGNHKNEVFLYTLDDLNLELKKDKLDFRVHNYCYSHDGSFIVASGFNEIRIMDPELTHLFSFSTNDDYKSFYKTKLNANSTILAVLAKQQDLNEFYTIEYYDIQKKRCTYSAKIERTNFSSFNGLSFSPDETELMIVLNIKCITTRTPFGINKQAALIHWILKNYQTNNPEIPREIVQHIVNAYVEVL